ncbi:MAG TPA: CRTAC1 family protein [Cyclobacteriaceae bacterium]|nr:CRTAC1 family protein [Cyclobacteriaceae bacterium]
MLQRIADHKVPSLLFIAIACCLPQHNNTLRAQTIFKDVTAEAGIQHQFAVFEGLFGGGACVADINNDGFEDLYLTGGMNDDALYLNNGNGTFKDIFETSGVRATTHYVTQGVVGADVNRDGWVDLFITTITTRDSVKRIPRAENLLFLNNGDLTFTDATKKYKLDHLMSFSTSACFGDFNADGYPDLYVCNYFQGYDGPLNVINDATIVNAEKTSKGYLLKNIDGEYFSDVFADYGLAHKGFAFGASFTDYDNDNDVDLFINHDFGFKAQPNVLLNNQYPHKSFDDVTKALNMDLQLNAMGTGIGDVNNDGFFDYYVTNIRFNHLMMSQGKGKPFIDKAKVLGMGFVSISWGANFADFDHDTDLDLYVANGDLNPNDVPLADFYFENEGGHFTDKAYLIGLNDYGVGRGSVTFDMDNDGDLDILIVNQKPVLNYPVSSMTRLYRNDSTKGNWIKIGLKGVESDMHGIGSRVEVVIGKTKMIREIDGGSSIFSQNSTIAHFGLGDATKVDSIIVAWIGNGRQVLTNQPVNTLLTIVENVPETSVSLWIPLIIISISALMIFSLFRLIKRNS